MKKWHALILLLIPALTWSMLHPAPAQEQAGDVLFSRHRHFRIPFQTGGADNRLRQLQLFVSTDQGKTWQPSAIAAPEQGHFRFICDRDGLYWFTVQTLDQDNRYYPPTMERAQPSLKVVVDTVPPTVTLRALPPRGGEVGVIWDVRDDYLDVTSPTALKLDYRQGGGNWLPLAFHPAASQHYWNPETNAPVEVRLRARDRAGNEGEATVVVSLQGAATPFQPNPPPGDPQGLAGLPHGYSPTDPNRRLVNSKRISLNYELSDVGPSGISAMELWFTQDGRNWNKYPLPAQDGEHRDRKQVVFEVNSEGIYGFTLVARSGVGLGERPPQVGDRPQLWVEVDLTKPAVQLHQVVVGQGADKGKLMIVWSAQDRNLHPQPIKLSYAEQLTGTWTTIQQNLANSGRYIWQMPETVPYQFHVKVEAADLAGNIGEAITRDLIKVDLSQPRVKIVNVSPAHP